MSLSRQCSVKQSCPSKCYEYKRIASNTIRSWYRKSSTYSKFHENQKRAELYYTINCYVNYGSSVGTTETCFLFFNYTLRELSMKILIFLHTIFYLYFRIET